MTGGQFPLKRTLHDIVIVRTRFHCVVWLGTIWLRSWKKPEKWMCVVYQPWSNSGMAPELCQTWCISGVLQSCSFLYGAVWRLVKIVFQIQKLIWIEWHTTKTWRRQLTDLNFHNHGMNNNSRRTIMTTIYIIIRLSHVMRGTHQANVYGVSVASAKMLFTGFASWT